MRAIVTVNTLEWNKAISDVITATKRAEADVINQAALDVTGYAFDSIPPADARTKRGEIKSELNQIRQRYEREIKTGPNKGTKKHVKSRSLRAIHLIINAARGMRGDAGLYGKDMKAYAGAVSGRRQRGAGFLKGVFIPAIRMLNPLVKYKFPFSKTRSINRWPGSAAYGIAVPAKPGANPVAIITTAPKVHGSSQDSKLMNMYRVAIAGAIQWKTGKLQREAERAFRAIFNKHSGRRRF